VEPHSENRAGLVLALDYQRSVDGGDAVAQPLKAATTVYLGATDPVVAHFDC
jgi:hypothetical protein